VDDGIVRVARHVEHRHGRLEGGEPFRELATTHTRHHDIRQHQVDRPGVSFTDPEGFAPVTRFQDRIPVGLEDIVGQIPHGRLVLDQQNGLAPVG